MRLSVAVLVGLSLDYLGSGNAHAYADAYRDWVRLKSRAGETTLRAEARI